MKLLAKSVVVVCILVMFSITVTAEVLTLDDALDIAVNQTGRGGIIEGNIEVAEQQYFAERIGFYVPEITINGRLPTYAVREDFDFAQGSDLKFLLKRTDFDFDADITLRQNLITGGDLELRANLVDNDWKYPVLRDEFNVVDSTHNYYLQPIDEGRQRGTFNFIFEQPLLKPSEPLYQLRNRRDDLKIAGLTRSDDIVELEKEVVSAYLGVLKSRFNVEKGEENLERALIQAGIDSLKLQDGVISEEQWLESVTNRLDAELEQQEQQRVSEEQKRALATLLDITGVEDLELVAPENIAHLDEASQQRLLARWEECIPLIRAKHTYDKEKRAADYAAGSHGLTGTFLATYGLDRGTVEDNRMGYLNSQDVETNSWSVSLNVSYPLWDGGASGAAVKVAKLSAESARLEYEKTENSVQAEISSLINQLNVSFRKLDVLKQKIDIAKTKLEIARSRFDDGQISKLTYLESDILLLEARNDHLEELDKYFSTRIQLEGKYLD